jgi:alkylation response protein AidB-like acyl-CoA dehydrogenase
MAPESATLAAQSDAAPDALERVRRLAPLIEASAGRAEQARELAPEVVDGLHEAGLFRLLLPKRFGGAELDPLSYWRVLEAVAACDGSTAWCLGQGNGCAVTAAFVEPAVAEEIWGRDARAVLAWGPGKGEARTDGDGWRLSGRWYFASGSRHATWLGGHATVTDGDGELQRLPDGSPLVRILLFPAATAERIDVWDVVGLRATGSDEFTVSDLVVGRDHIFTRDDPADRRIEAPLYLFPTTGLYAIGFSAVALGIARPMLDAFVALAGEKTPRLARSRLADNAVVQAEVAIAEARLGAARSFILDELDDIWRQVVASGRLTVEQRMRIRLATTWGIHAARQVGDVAYELSGATAIFASQPFERRFRDLHTVTQQMQGRRAHFETVGAFLLGHEPDLSSV